MTVAFVAIALSPLIAWATLIAWAPLIATMRNVDDDVEADADCVDLETDVAPVSARMDDVAAAVEDAVADVAASVAASVAAVVEIEAAVVASVAVVGEDAIAVVEDGLDVIVKVVEAGGVLRGEGDAESCDDVRKQEKLHSTDWADAQDGFGRKSKESPTKLQIKKQRKRIHTFRKKSRKLSIIFKMVFKDRNNFTGGSERCSVRNDICRGCQRFTRYGPDQRCMAAWNLGISQPIPSTTANLKTTTDLL